MGTTSGQGLMWIGSANSCKLVLQVELAMGELVVRCPFSGAPV